jgi:hypothetical protein
MLARAASPAQCTSTSKYIMLHSCPFAESRKERIAKKYDNGDPQSHREESSRSLLQESSTSSNNTPIHRNMCTFNRNALHWWYLVKEGWGAGLLVEREEDLCLLVFLKKQKKQKK